MPNLNRVFLMGNLTRDPELKYTPKGTAVAEFGMAINRVYSTDQGERREEVTFVDITFWGASAETLQKYVGKGDPLFVEGHLQLDTWDDRQTGQKRSKMRVIGESFQFLKSKPKEDGEPQDRQQQQSTGRRPDPGGYQGQTTQSSRRPAAPPPPPKPPHDPDLDADDDDIPF